MKTIAAFIFAQILCLPLYAQENPETGSRGGLTLSLSPVLSGFVWKVKEDMGRTGFGDTQEFLFGIFGDFGERDFPIVPFRPAFQVGLELPSRRAWTAKVLLSQWSGRVQGYSRVFGHFQVQPTIFTSSAMVVAYTPDRVARFAVGPAFHAIRIRSDASVTSFPEQKETKFGFGLETGIRFPARSRFYADIQAQYFYVGRADVGPYAITGSDGAVSKTVAYPSSPLSYVTIGLGAGVRLR